MGIDHSVTLLFVDDDQTMLALYRMLFRGEYHLLCVRNAREALMFLNNTISLVVTDDEMAGVSGRELIAAIHGTYPLMPTLLVSGKEQPPDYTGAFIRKPFEVAHFTAVVRYLISMTRRI